MLGGRWSLRGEKPIMMRGLTVRGVPAVLAAMALVLSACSADSTAADAVPTGVSDSTEPIATETSEPTSKPTKPTYSPQAGEVMELPQENGWAILRQGRYAVRVTPTLSYEVDVADRVKVLNGRFLNSRSASGSGWAGIFFVSTASAEGTTLPAHPCLNHVDKRMVGPSVSDLAGELRSQPVLEVTKPVPVALDGNRGLYLEVKIPDNVVTDGCVDDTVELFSSGPDSWGWHQGFVGHWWILDVDGERVVVGPQCDTGCSKDDFDTLTEMAESVTFASAK